MRPKKAEKYGAVHIAADTSTCGHTRIPQQSELRLDARASYFYYCANNTIYGTEWQYVPETGRVPLACDMSSDILSRPVDVSKYGVIFAGAQKNMAPAGLTVAIVDRSLAGHELPITPIMYSYQRMIDKDSMYNTPPCWCIYILGLVLAWLERQGGVAGHAAAQACARRKGVRFSRQQRAVSSLRPAGLPLGYERYVPHRGRCARQGVYQRCGGARSAES